jgi:hypothetical protein
MKKIILTLLLATSACFAPCMAQKTFNPATDTVAITNTQGIWRILIPEKVLIASAQLVNNILYEVHDVRIQDIHNKPHLFFRGKNKNSPAMGYTVMVALEQPAKGIWKVGSTYQACWGDACSTCGFDEYWGCACERYDGVTDEPVNSYCNHMVALGLGLSTITYEERE